MKALVAIKRVADHTAAVRIQSDHGNVDLSDTKMIMNPYCEIALEEAIRQKEAGVVSEVVAVSVGASLCQAQLRAALALGADRAIHVETDASLEPLHIAKLLRQVVDVEQPMLILTGKQSVDSDNNQTGQMLAGLLGIAQGTFAAQLVIEDAHIQVTREVDGGQQTVRLTLPAVITADLTLNTPRYASLPNVMKAKRKPIEVIPAETLGVDLSKNDRSGHDRSGHTRLLRVEPLGGQRAGVKVANVDELIQKLKQEARVI